MNLVPDNVNVVRLSHQTFRHKAVMSMSDEQKMLERLGLDFDLVDAGCCGWLALSVFEKQHYEVSIKAGERVLLPRVREAAPETLIIANGFSCREQIAHTTDRRPAHLTEVIRMVF